MIEVSRRVPVPPDDVFAVLEDGWSFAGWVVGASHIRAVDETWPAVGSRIHHSFGPWPLSIDDVTEVLAVEPNAMLELEAKAWPTGSARVRITLVPLGNTDTEIRMAEGFEKGPARLLPAAVQAALLKPRNKESLRRLADIATGRRRRM